MHFVAPRSSRIETFGRIFATVIAFIGAIIFSWAVADYPYTQSGDIGFWSLYVVGACFTVAINTFLVALAPVLSNDESMRFPAVLLFWDLSILCTYLASMIFNWWPFETIVYNYSIDNSGGLQGLVAVSVMNCILLATYIALVVVDIRRVHRKRIALKAGLKSKHYEPSIELPVRGANVEDPDPTALTARFVPSVKSVEGASAQHVRDFI